MKPVKPGTVQEKVLTYLNTGHSIDHPKVTAMFGYHQLPVAIHHLRKKGHDIRKEMVKSKDGNAFAVYRLVPPFRIGEKVRLPDGSTGTVSIAASEGGYVFVKVKREDRLCVHHHKNLERVHA